MKIQEQKLPTFFFQKKKKKTRCQSRKEMGTPLIPIGHPENHFPVEHLLVLTESKTVKETFFRRTKSVSSSF